MCDKIPVVNMVRNMEPFVSGIKGNPLSERLRNWVRRIDGKFTFRMSNRLIAVSSYVRNFLLSVCKIPAEKIGIVYHGIDLPEDRYAYPPKAIPPGWQGEFLFTAGSVRPARGLEDLLQAIKYLSDSSMDFPGLVIAGETTSSMAKYRAILKDWIRVHNLSSKVCWVDDLDEQQMSWCYRYCKAFVMTSRVESFGMIGGEAMAHGCICISAKNPCLPEIFGDSAIYYKPKEGKALATAIRNVMDLSLQHRQVMSERSKERAAKFSWDVTAMETIHELAKVFGR